VKVPHKPVISVVDDDETVRETTTDLLTAMGFVAVAFSSATDFLNSGQQHNTSCLVADVQMVGMNGLELHSRLVGSGNTIPTILITAYPNDRDKVRALQAGVACYLAKPFTHHNLLACIRGALGLGELGEMQATHDSLHVGRAYPLQQEELAMPAHSSMHFYLNWTKERLDEMDAALASLEAKASQRKAGAKAKADQLIADLKKRRDEFQAGAKAQAQANEAAWQAAKTQMESQWNSFETQVKTYFETVEKQIEQQRSTFSDLASAQMKGWREAADRFHDAAAQVASEKRASVDAAVKQMKADATEAERRLHKLRQAGGESWAALGAALAESRKAFDQANQKAWDALKRAGSPNN
jgi:FixJ family two-component response regulator